MLPRYKKTNVARCYRVHGFSTPSGGKWQPRLCLGHFTVILPLGCTKHHGSRHSVQHLENFNFYIYYQHLVVCLTALTRYTLLVILRVELLVVFFTLWDYSFNVFTIYWLLVWLQCMVLPTGCDGVLGRWFFDRCCDRNLYGWRSNCKRVSRGKHTHYF